MKNDPRSPVHTPRPGALAIIFVCALISLVGAVGPVFLLYRSFPFGDLLFLALGALIFFGLQLCLHRLVLRILPLEEGEVRAGSRLELAYHTYLFFYLFFFYPLNRSRNMPVGLMRELLRALGAKMGPNTYCSGVMLDPPLTTVGANTILGQDCLLIGHMIATGRPTTHRRIVIGDRVTVGAGAIVLAGVRIGDDAVVAAGSVVTAGTVIPPGETWADVPARCLRRAPPSIPDRPGRHEPAPDHPPDLSLP